MRIMPRLSLALEVLDAFVAFVIVVAAATRIDGVGLIPRAYSASPHNSHDPEPHSGPRAKRHLP